MVDDPTEDEDDALPIEDSTPYEPNNITAIDPTDEWSQFRVNMALDMFSTWQSC